MNVVDMQNRTVLVYVIASMKDDFAEFLVDQGANPNISFQSMYNGNLVTMSPLVEAIQGEPGLVQVLVKKGAHVEDIDRQIIRDYNDMRLSLWLGMSWNQDCMAVSVSACRHCNIAEIAVMSAANGMRQGTTSGSGQHDEEI